ncbi:MAG: aminotransferase class V-fold PLP-dependent enzyme [Oscillospiraceae bacterium]|nr:aminotransferase class V-fold PLP-dependent enzyme [Oscillospiraceae bacterium]
MTINWEKIRKVEWPVLDTMTFLDAACVSFAPQRTVRAIKEFANFSARQDEENSSEHHIKMDSMRNKAYEEAAKLLNSEPEEIAIVESTTHGLNIAANAIRLEDGDNIVTTNLEFIQVALPWCMIKKQRDIDIRIVKTKDNRFHVSDFEAVCDDRTRLIVLSSVEWCNGWKMDLREIGEYCVSKKIYLVVDAVQQLGVSKMDTKEFHVDFLVAGGHKWLNSPYGAGVLYINRKTMPEFEQVYWGYLNTETPPEGWGGYWENPAAQAVSDWKFEMCARKFEIGGTSNYAGAIALGETLELVNEIGVENIERRIFEITEYCMDELEKLGAALITHRDRDRRSGIVIARLYADLAIERMVLRELHASKIYIAQRFTDNVGGFRISCQYFNNERDIDNMIGKMKEIIEEKIGKNPDYSRIDA